ncbi:hypothetical protein V6N11_050928 [Hibiscus sabdariffa]|uniref:Uncharacterized protein n=1 Tax=Hibiscus sabdariffa TaxID=183260 RepID=A0ABR2R2C3_9ROSI
MPIPEASHSSSNVLVKSGKRKIGAEHNLSFKAKKASSCATPHVKPTEFLIISVKGAAIVEKSLTNRRYKLARPWNYLTSEIDVGVGHSRIALTFSSSTWIP